MLLGNVAAFYQETGRFAEARKLYDDAAGIISRTLGEASEDFANVSANLGDMCEDLGEYEESERHLGHALQIYRHLDDSDHRADVVRVLNTLGVLRKTRGDYVAAESLFREALDLQRTTPSVNESLHAALLNNFASLSTRRYRRLAEWPRKRFLPDPRLRAGRDAIRPRPASSTGDAPGEAPGHWPGTKQPGRSLPQHWRVRTSGAIAACCARN